MTQTSPKPTADRPAQETISLHPAPNSNKSTSPPPKSHSRRMSLRAKATALAIALSTLPVIAVGTTAYYFANRSITQQIIRQQQSTAIDLEDRLELFVQSRFLDVQAMANLDIFTNPQTRSITTRQAKDTALNNLVTAYNGMYDSIAVFDLNGDVVAQSKGKPISNHRKAVYFQEALKTGRAYLSEPKIADNSTNVVRTFTIAAPIKDSVTGENIGVIRARMPLAANKLLDVDNRRQEQFYVVNSAGQIFLTSNEEDLGKSFEQQFPKLFNQVQAGNSLDIASTIENQSTANKLVSYAAAEELRELHNLNWGVIVSTPSNIVFLPQRQLLLTFLLGTGLTTLLVGVLAAYLTNRAVKPILKASDAVTQIKEGKLDTRVVISGEDELAMLGNNINSMAARLQQLLDNQVAEAERTRIVKDITLRLGQFPQVQDIFNTVVKEIRAELQADRVVVYTFNDKWQGTIIAESVAEGFPQANGANINDPCFADKYVERYRQGRVQATENIYTAGLTECHIKQLEQFAVKANLVAPVLQGGELLGLLIAHQCSAPRNWQQGEIDLFAQIATQVGFALDRAKLLEQQIKEKEKLQKRALELLMEVDPLNKGDLTIRANVTEDEIGTIADSYNATISSLRQLVNNVKTAAEQVTATTNNSESSVQVLSQEALRQAEEINAALNQLQAMEDSIRAVAQSAKQAEVAVHKATETVAAGDAAMNRTVDGIEAIRATVAATAEKVRQLGESSQKISKVVNLIGRFAAQTNLLALKASIEAARAGEEGRGFAVLADEVRILASQSAQATGEIEKLVLDIQAETNAVVAAMEAGTEQVSKGTILVDETRQHLTQITAISEEIGNLVQAISEASLVQSHAAHAVTQTMNDVAAIANQTSDEATQVSSAFQQLLTVADRLQTSVGQFKVS
ncbi:methyl-accepting chemotaxis protein [Chroococcidiopsis sp. TS-821]|uniref:methyl-accepting chemotaxis protein n=1 Tax=Chroococcidiopsis sp. TS-821 TaxID=1378066 RepID=UPI000CEF0670|nr:methyl-accepting chemotaxis protein [Chroococcidiopsis sp. TS-821]PPS45524.1 chemotaxis protein [Chroococcidiopsis sp. TS-821]